MLQLNISVPGPWQFLTDQQLQYVFELLAENYSATELKTLFLLHFGKLKVISKMGNAYILKHEGKEYTITAKQIAESLSAISWLDSIPGYPTRLSKINGHEALPADFQEVPFEKYLYLDNLYQGYLYSQKDDLMDEMATILYSADDIHLSSAERINVFYWFSSLKELFTKTFRHFYISSPATNSEEKSLRDTLSEAMNAQIRALTGGDITKEKEVLAMDTWRALTELDAKARDNEEIRKLSK